MTKKGVSVVVPSFNNKKTLFRLLDSVFASEFKKLEVVVVDNSTTNKILIAGIKKYPKVKWIDAGRENLGQTSVYNLGFANANIQNHILYCDEDVVLDPLMITHLFNRLESKKNIGMVTPMILYLNDKNWVNQAGSEVDLFTGKVRIGWGDKTNFSEAKQIQGSGTVMLFKRSLVNKIGGFEEWYICYSDPEYCVRASKAGYTSWYEPKAICYHDQSKDPKVWGPRVLSRAYFLGRNRTLFMKKYGNMLGYTLFLPILLSYYLYISIKFNILHKWFELLKGSVVGYFYPVNTSLKVKLPKVN